MQPAKLTLPLLLLGASCTALLGVEEGVLDDGSGGVGATTTTSASVSSSASGDAASTGSSSSGSVASSTSSAGSGTGGVGGVGGVGGSPASTAETSTGSGGEGGAGGLGGGGGGTAASSGAGGSGGEASSTGAGGEGGGCALPALPACRGLQPNTFSVNSDLTTYWDELAPEASVTPGGALQLRIEPGTSEARIQAKTSLNEPASCAAWIRLVMPNTGADVESGIAIVADGEAFLAYHLEDELRVRDPLGAMASTPYGAATELVRARFDDGGDLWFDASPDGACWAEVDGPFTLGANVEVQLYVDRPGSTGNTSSTFDDFSR